MTGMSSCVCIAVIAMPPSPYDALSANAGPMPMFAGMGTATLFTRIVSRGCQWMPAVVMTLGSAEVSERDKNVPPTSSATTTALTIRIVFMVLVIMLTVAAAAVGEIPDRLDLLAGEAVLLDE